MTTSQNDALLAELNGDGPLSVGTRAFLGARARNAFFNFIHGKLRDAKEKGLTQAKLAERIGKDPGRLSNTLSSPGNWTIDTIAELLFGITGDELVLGSRQLLGRPPVNMKAIYVVKDASVDSDTRSAAKVVELTVQKELENA